MIWNLTPPRTKFKNEVLLIQTQYRRDENIKNTTLGLNLAKSIFLYGVIDVSNQFIAREKLRKNQPLKKLSNLEVVRIAMEAYASSHYWDRKLLELVHDVLLIPRHKVKAYVQGQRNDINDVLAIAEAATRPGLKTVQVKTLAQPQATL